MASFISLFSYSDLPISVFTAAIGYTVETGLMGSVLSDPLTRQAFVSTLLSTIFLVPALAIGAVKLVNMAETVPAEGVLGIMTVSVLPGGPLALIFAVLTGANSELNVVLTSCEVVLTIGMAPAGLLFVLPNVFDEDQVIKVPYWEMAHGMVIVLGPIMLGVGLSAVHSSFSTSLGADAKRRQKKFVFRLIVVLSVLLAIYTRRTFPEEVNVYAQLGTLVHAGWPPAATFLAALSFSVLVVAWSIVIGCVLPSQPLANRLSMCLEISVRDLTISLVIAFLGVPSLPQAQRTQVAYAVVIVCAVCNLGIFWVASLYALCARGSVAAKLEADRRQREQYAVVRRHHTTLLL